MLTENLTFCESLKSFLKLCYRDNAPTRKPLKTLIRKIPAEFQILWLATIVYIVNNPNVKD